MNKQVLLLNRPTGDIQLSDFQLSESLLRTSLNLGEVLIKVEWLSIDPAQRVWISGARSYIPPVALNGVVRALGTGLVIASKSPAFKKGDHVSGFLNWQEFATVHASSLSKLPSYANPQLYLGVLGMTGLTAYFAITELSKPEKGETLLVSTAAGAVGSVACQLGKLRGCKVIGICGSDEKESWLMNEIKIDGCINYKKEKNLLQAIRKICPEGVDVYIDNVGGPVLDAALANIRKNARIVLCGAISSYSQKKALPIHNYSVAIANSASIEGFIVWDYMEQFASAAKHLGKLVQEKKILYKEHVVDGLENAPKALKMVMAGENFGKMVVRVNHEQPRL